ncbi:MAG: YaiI/YqxD family protein [Proteobacteria bacterium]|nr:YaiI/YqxD family protein [Pseudomonadota bacterium]MBU1595736.1 YaiI/YqxD family protein [Pseudomonadota bacterium]
MHIWIDADACPTPIKEILLRSAMRLGIPTTLVANKNLSVPASPHVATLRVGQGFDVVDETIARLVQPGDLVVTADIPLAAKVIERGATGLNPRGELYTAENIGPRLTMRNMLDELRSTGVSTGGPAPLSLADRNAFANQLDRFLSARARPAPAP